MGSVGIILAAGKGTRMMSAVPKVLHEVCGVSMVEHVRRSLIAAGCDSIVVVVSPENAEAIKLKVSDPAIQFAIQDPPLGTGHAAQSALEFIPDDADDVLLVCGDTPLLKPETLQRLSLGRRERGAAIAVATFIPHFMGDYGRVHRKGEEAVEIIEAASPGADGPHLTEANAGVYSVSAAVLHELLPKLPIRPEKGEYFLTDIVAAIRRTGGRAYAPPPFGEEEFMGVNDRWALAEAAKVMRERILRRLAREGVTIVDPASTYVEADVRCENDVTILPMTVIEGRTTIGGGSAIGPNSWIKDAKIGRDVRIFMSHLDQVEVGDGSRCGPFSNLRPGTVLASGVKVGNFVEIKNADIGDKVSISHLTYIGDASIGSQSNIGAGTITCNYDGFTKSRTTIGAEVFVGSNSTLVAPVSIGDGAFVAAGSVITRDVPEDAMSIGRARQENKEQWANKWRSRKRSDSNPAENSKT